MGDALIELETDYQGDLGAFIAGLDQLKNTASEYGFIFDYILVDDPESEKFFIRIWAKEGKRAWFEIGIDQETKNDESVLSFCGFGADNGLKELYELWILLSGNFNLKGSWPESKRIKCWDEKKVTRRRARKTLSNFTEREKQIALCVQLGEKNRQIEDKLNIRYSTLRTHLSNIYKKLGIDMHDGREKRKKLVDLMDQSGLNQNW